MYSKLQVLLNGLQQLPSMLRTSRAQLSTTENSKRSALIPTRANTWFCFSTPWICKCLGEMVLFTGL